jgi:TetR/AcrR family transcriptional regulator
MGAEVNRAKRQPAPAKRARIVDVAMRHFAEHGYEEARTADIAREAGIAKGAVFQHFGSKHGLFLAAYVRAAESFSRYLDAPAEVKAKGFWEVLRYWLSRTEFQVRENWQPYRVVLLGNYGTDLRLKREINRFLATEDPYGTAAFVRAGLKEGAVRSDVDVEMIVSLLEWTVERFQDALLTEELDPGLFRRQGISEEKTSRRMEHFLRLLQSAIGESSRVGQPSSKKVPRRTAG